ncbi:hypothetical protein XENOCAPTIV_015247 [Xenoophorus captivus]|uniref:Uncharacterized protein n=1 Tax=Xenoophorus captivus TaxID=1517983 RepID=A0ABV0QA39_9TELE
MWQWQHHPVRMLEFNWTGMLVRGGGKMDGAKYRVIPEENILETINDWGFKFYFKLEAMYRFPSTSQIGLLYVGLSHEIQIKYTAQKNKGKTQITHPRSE